MKVEIELDIDSKDKALFLKTLAFFTWNNPADLSFDKLIIDNQEIEVHSFWKEHSQSKYISLEKMEKFWELVEGSQKTLLK